MSNSGCHFPIGILGQVWCLIVSFPDLCPFLTFKTNYKIPDIKDTFNLLDRDHDGKLDKKELETLLRYTGSLKSDSEMEELLSPVDTDRKFSY